MKTTVLFTIIATLILLFANNTLAETATPEGQSVLDKIKEKVEAIRSNPKAYIGPITDKTENSIQIKDIDGKIQQISVKSDVSIVKTGKSNTNIKFADLAIGDYIVAMGLTTGNGVLDAKRILLTDPIEPPSRKIVFGTVSELRNKELTIKPGEGEGKELTFIFPKRWKGPETKEIKKDLKMLVVSVTSNGKDTVRTTEIINISSPSSPTGIEKQ